MEFQEPYRTFSGQCSWNPIFVQEDQLYSPMRGGRWDRSPSDEREIVWPCSETIPAPVDEFRNDNIEDSCALGVSRLEGRYQRHERGAGRRHRRYVLDFVLLKELHCGTDVVLLVVVRYGGIIGLVLGEEVTDPIGHMVEELRTLRGHECRHFQEPVA